MEDASNSFKITAERLDEDASYSLPISPEGLEELVQANDITKIVAALYTNIDSGISGTREDLNRRTKVFGSNTLEYRPSLVDAKGFHQLILEALKDSPVILLLCCAALSTVIGIKRSGLRQGVLDGAIVLLPIFIAVNFGAIFRFAKARRTRRLQRKVKTNVKILRSGEVHELPVPEVVVGDVICLNTGDCVPADGLLIDAGDSLKLDDDRCDGYRNQPYLFAGAKVVEGNCRMLVTSVGKNTEKSKLTKSLSFRHQNEPSKLEISLGKMNSRLEMVWLIALLLYLAVQAMKCFVWGSVQCDKDHNPDPIDVKDTVEEIMEEFTKLMMKQGFRFYRLVAMICVLIFSSRDGLPWGISLSLAYAARKLMELYQAKVQKHAASATLGLITTVLLGKTSDLVNLNMEACKEYGIDIKLDVDDDLNTATFMANNFGILMEDGMIIEASVFRNLSEKDQLNMADRIRVMAGSSPADMLLLLQLLKKKGQVVAVVGASSRDSPVLEEADLGFSVGENAGELAKEASDVIIMGQKSVPDIFPILGFGRFVCNNIQKFVQLQLTLNISAFAINYILLLSNMREPIGHLELLWVNLIVNIFGALALAQPPPITETAMDPPKFGKKGFQYLTKRVCRNIAVQACYQVAVVLILYFKGKWILGTNRKILEAMIFNCYVGCQVIVLINARGIQYGRKENNMFWVLVAAIVILQVAFMEIMPVLSRMGRLDLKQWAVCVGIAAFCLPLGWVAK
ncbi:putative calcium-transporting ATPase 13, plasma membrane-type [Diospyros lotus]|uniref:putative calcium-transporting ATPase 13, plasma membrane-type n=1 Tax=Diospyros lotus TaxID=55363 RepID=UPI00225595FF|nr:putative calcium-transporting ATPase 13, plasma membrane-type [Diospyros lotus]